MDRRERVRHLKDHGCRFVREGGNHTTYRNPANGRIRSIPRHREIKDTTVREICKGLGIRTP